MSDPECVLLNYSAPSLTCAKRNPIQEESDFPYEVPKAGIMPSICESQGEELHLLNTSHNTLIISAVLERTRPPPGAGQYHKSMMHWVRPGLVSEAISAQRVWVRQEVKPKW